MAHYAPMLSEDHWNLPVAMAHEGHWLSLREVIEEEPARFSFIELSPEQQSELVAERIKQRPEFDDVGIMGIEIVDKTRAINEILKRTSIGCTLIDIERRMIETLIKHAHDGNL